MLRGSVLTLVLGVADDTKSLLAFAVVGRGTGLGSSFVPGSLLGMTSCFSCRLVHLQFELGRTLCLPFLRLLLAPNPSSGQSGMLMVVTALCLLDEGLLTP